MNREGGVTGGEGRGVGGDEGFIGPLGVNGDEQFGGGDNCEEERKCNNETINTSM